MAKKTVDLKSIVEHFQDLPDPRHNRNRKHLLGDIIAISVCGVIVGCTGPTAINQWAAAKEDCLRPLLELPNGIPSRDCIRRVLTTLKPEAFQACFAKWIASLMPQNDNAGQTIAIDGKTMRRSHDEGSGLGALHMVSAWAGENGLSLGQVATDAKSNEITAIPALLDQINVSGAVVTIDAMGCQKAIAAKIVKGKGDYVLAVKENQPKLYNYLKEFFDEARQDELAAMPHREHSTFDKGHGRRDERYYVLAKLPSDFPFKDNWPSIKAIGMSMRVSEGKGGATIGEIRYFICSRYFSGERFAQAVRNHWSIENSLHWVLDVTFDEDQTRTRDRHMADNLSWLRRFAISLLKRFPSKHSIKGKARICGWNNDFLMQVLMNTGG